MKSKVSNKNKTAGFSLVELILAMTLTLILLGIISSLFAKSLGIRERESRKTDALTSAQAALNVMSREIANSGFGLTSNGIVVSDSSATKLHFRTNIDNTDLRTNGAGEDITYYFDQDSQSILKYDKFGFPKSAAVINKISSVSFRYFDYAGSNSTPIESNTPSTDTGRVRITITVNLEEIIGQPTNQTVTYTSDVTLRNSNYMLNQY